MLIVRQYMLPIVLGISVLVTAIGVVYSKHETRRLFVTLQNLENERDGMNFDWGRLQLEQSTWGTHSRVATTADKKLDMVVPDMNDITIVTTNREKTSE